MTVDQKTCEHNWQIAFFKQSRAHFEYIYLYVCSKCYAVKTVIVTERGKKPLSVNVSITHNITKEHEWHESV